MQTTKKEKRRREHRERVKICEVKQIVKMMVSCKTEFLVKGTHIHWNNISKIELLCLQLGT